MVNSENAKAQMRKGVLELCILSILSQGEAYPTEIIEKLKQECFYVREDESYFYPYKVHLNEPPIIKKESLSFSKVINNAN